MYNVEANLLAKLALVHNLKLNRTTLFEYLEASSIYDKQLLTMAAEQDRGWKLPVIGICNMEKNRPLKQKLESTSTRLPTIY